MFIKLALFVYLQALLIQGFSAQCNRAYNALAAVEGLSWPAANSLAAWESAIPWAGASPCAASATGVAPWGAAPFTTTEWGAGYSPARLAASNGGGLAIASASPIAPNGVAMNSENIYEGRLAVSGAMPFLGAVALEGALPTGGAGTVTYGCGNGNVAIINEDYASGYGADALGSGTGIGGPAYGYKGCAHPAVIDSGIFGPAFGTGGARFGACGCGLPY